ncbi:MAG: amidohydrolase family protein [Streptosporangiales bacterium]|nr:amidohydrolase family protein [Streptosporangiales bacterium]
MIVDAHLHVFTAHDDPHPRLVDELAPAERTAPAEDLIAVQDEAGVERAVLVPLGPEDDYVAEVRRAHPGRFAAIGVADDAMLGRVPDADPVERLRERVDAYGLAGIRLNHLGEPGVLVTDSPVFSVLEELERTGRVLWFYAPPDQLPLLAGALAALPGLRVVLNHLGFCPTGMTVDEHGRPRIAPPIPPPTLPGVLSLARFRQVHIMISGEYAFSAGEHPYEDLSPLVRQLYGAYGADRLMWASDYPWTRDVPGYRRLLDLPRLHLPGLTEAELAAIRGGTALELFTDLWGD